MDKFDCIKATHVECTESEYWESRVEQDKQLPELPLMKNCCGDCAVKNGFYTPFSDSLKLQPVDIIQQVLPKWFCHNNCNRACRGAYDAVTSYPRS